MRFAALQIFTALLFISAVGQEPVRGQSTAGGDQASADLIHFGDLIDVDVVGSLEFDWRGTLTPEGFLDGYDKVPEPVFALCRSEDDLAKAIADEYKVLLKNPRVVVRVLDRSNRAVAFLDGAVKFPQRFQLRRRVLLNEMIVLSGGITDRSNGEIRIFRPQNLNCATRDGRPSGEAKPQNVVIRIADLLSGSAEANPQISSGDIVTVVEASPIYLTGGVNRPRQIPWRERTTLSRAIAAAGGVAREGREDKIRIFRRSGSERKVIEASLRKIRSRDADDPLLEAFDIVDVEEKGKPPNKLPPVADLKDLAGDRLSKLPLRIVD